MNARYFPPLLPDKGSGGVSYVQEQESLGKSG